jgi:drug/metabolite transporter (DMT)-like permease
MTAGAFFVQNWGQRHTTAVRAALIYTLEPVVAALFSHFYGGEPLASADWLGGGLIVLGVVAGEVGGALEGRARAGAASPGEPSAEFPVRPTVP